VAWTETVEVVRNTFRSALDLMREYPDFKFTMSSARTYVWMEEKYSGICSIDRVDDRIRKLFFHPDVCARGRHREFEIRIFAHQVECAAERVAYDFHGFCPGPQPRHVNVRVAAARIVNCFSQGSKHFEFSLRLAQRFIKR